MGKDKSKKILILVVIFAVILTIISGSYAYWLWITSEEQRTMVSFSVNSSFSCSADGGGDITNENTLLTPTSDCTNLDYAIKREIKVTPEIKRDGLSINLDMWLNINSIDPELTDHDGFRYAITTNNNSCTEGVMASGSFKGISVNDKVNLLSKQQYTRTSIIPDTYYLYLWLDGDKTPNDTQDKKFDFSLGGDCSDSKTLSNSVMALANTSDSGVYHETKTGNYVVITANESEWSSVEVEHFVDDLGEEHEDIILNNPVFTSQGDYWSVKTTVVEVEEGDAVVDGKMILKPKETANYKLDVYVYTMSLRILIDGELFSISEENCEYETEPGEMAYVEDDIYDAYIGTSCEIDLGYLTPENEIEINILEVDLADGNGSLKFYQLDPNKVIDLGYRYEGKNVDNYIKFNDETWRIMGVEEGSTIGLEDGKRYTKIIRSESFDERSYEGELMLPDILNDGYFRRIKYDGDYEDYGDYTNVGLTEASSKLIVKPKWYGLDMGGLNNTTQQFYEKERKSYNDLFHVGLMSPSDYGYGALQSECRDITLDSYSRCINNNWLYTGLDEWLYSSGGEIETEEDYIIAYHGIDTNGNVTGFAMETPHAYRPVVYLKHNVLLMGGTGEIGSPYIVGYSE